MVYRFTHLSIVRLPKLDCATLIFQSINGECFDIYASCILISPRPSLYDLRIIPSGNQATKDTPGPSSSLTSVSSSFITTNMLRTRLTSSQDHANSSIPPTMGRDGRKAKHPLRPTSSEHRCYASTPRRTSWSGRASMGVIPITHPTVMLWRIIRGITDIHGALSRTTSGTARGSGITISTQTSTKSFANRIATRPETSSTLLIATPWSWWRAPISLRRREKCLKTLLDLPSFHSTWWSLRYVDFVDFCGGSLCWRVFKVIPERRALDLQVSLDGVRFAEGKFPPSLHPAAHVRLSDYFVRLRCWPTPS